MDHVKWEPSMGLVESDVTRYPQTVYDIMARKYLTTQTYAAAQTFHTHCLTGAWGTCVRWWDLEAVVCQGARMANGWCTHWVEDKPRAGTTGRQAVTLVELEYRPA